MEEDEKKDFAEALGISKPDEKKIKLLIEEAFEKTNTTEDAILFICGKNKMEIKPVFAGFCAGIVSTLGLVATGKIPVVIPIAMPMPVPVPMPVNIPNKPGIAG